MLQGHICSQYHPSTMPCGPAGQTAPSRWYGRKSTACLRLQHTEVATCGNDLVCQTSWIRTRCHLPSLRTTDSASILVQCGQERTCARIWDSGPSE